MQPPARDMDFLNSIFDYNSESGILTWKVRGDVPKWWNVRYAGKQPSNKDKLGYARAKITKGKFSAYVAVHRICFFMAHGFVPQVVDHIDGNVSNNKASNLRAATFEKNTWNRIPNVGTSTGYKGVSVCSKRGVISGYVARIGHGGVREYLGLFSTPEKARDAYNKREIELRPEWVRK